MEVYQSVQEENNSFSFTKKIILFSPFLAMCWFVLTVIGPHQDLYKAFFHLILIPASITILISGRSNIKWNDPFLTTSFVLFIYAGAMTFIVGLGPIEDHMRALRWSVEISFGLLFFYILMPTIIEKPQKWGYFFLLIAFLGSIGTILIFYFKNDLQGRATGLGALHHWVQVGSILLTYFAIGHFLLSAYNREVKTTYHKAFHFLTFTFVGLAILLSQSRAVIGNFIIYTLFISLLSFKKNKDVINIIAISSIIVIIFLIIMDQVFGLDVFLNQLLKRGLNQRDIIWTGYLFYPPDNLFFGVGAGTQPEFHPAYEAYWKPNNYIKAITHAHNLFIGTYSGLGIIGLGFLLFLFIFPSLAIIKSSATSRTKISLFGILGLVVMLNFTGSYTVVSSIKAIWLIFWLPVIFVWFWCRYHETDQYNSMKLNDF